MARICLLVAVVLAQELRRILCVVALNEQKLFGISFVSYCALIRWHRYEQVCVGEGGSEPGVCCQACCVRLYRLHIKPDSGSTGCTLNQTVEVYFLSV